MIKNKNKNRNMIDVQPFTDINNINLIIFRYVYRILEYFVGMNHLFLWKQKLNEYPSL